MPLFNCILPGIPVSMNHTRNIVFDVDPVTHTHLGTAPNPAYANTATLSAFTDSVPDDYAPEVRLARTVLMLPSSLNKVPI